MNKIDPILLEVVNNRLQSIANEMEDSLLKMSFSVIVKETVSYTHLDVYKRQTYGWNLNYGGIALMWRGGCIIRSVFLGKIKDAYDKNPNLENLLMDDYFAGVIRELVPAWREVVAYAVKAGIPMPAFSSALAYFDGYTMERLPANLLQAQRDYFGAHTYEPVSYTHLDVYKRQA